MSYEDDKWAEKPASRENPLAPAIATTNTLGKAVVKKRDRFGSLAYVHPHSLRTKQCTIESTRIVPQNIRTDPFVSNTYIDMEINGSYIDVCIQALVEVNLRNTNTAATAEAVMGTPWHWFRYIAEMPNGVSESVYYYPLDLKELWLLQNDATVINNCKMLNVRNFMNSVGYPGTRVTNGVFEPDLRFSTLAQGGTNGEASTWYLPLNIGVLTEHVNWRKVKVFPRFRFYWTQNDSVFARAPVLTSRADISLDKFQLYITGCKFHGKALRLLNEASNKPYIWQQFKPSRMILDINSINSNQETGYLYLNSIQGRYASLTYYVLDRSNLNDYGYWDEYVSIIEYNLRTSGGRVVGFEDVPSALMANFSKRTGSRYFDILTDKQNLVTSTWGVVDPNNIGLDIRQFGPYPDIYTDDFEAMQGQGAMLGAFEFNAKDTFQIKFGTNSDGTELNATDLQIHIQGRQRCQYKFDPVTGCFKFIRT